MYDRVRNASACNDLSFSRFLAIDLALSKIKQLKYYNLR